jgi:hypothetical protein
MSSCQKIRFQSRGEAKERDRDRRARGGQAKKTRPYLCPACGGWHLTSVPKTMARRKYA